MALLALAATADAATIYRWVDETGRIHLSDSVPDQYKARATAIDSRQFDIAPAEAAQARARAARDKAQAVAGATPSPSNPSGAMSGNAAPRTALTDAEFAQLDCNTQWKLYRESLECFAPYIQRVPWTAPPEAFQMCTVLKDPVGPLPGDQCPGIVERRDPVNAVAAPAGYDAPLIAHTSPMPDPRP